MANADKNGQAPNGMQGSSYIYQMGTSPNTRTAISQRHRILTPAYGDNAKLAQIGALSEFSPNLSRNIEQVRGMGFGDKVAELVPGNTEAPTASFNRTMLYQANLWQATGYASGIDGPVRSLAHHRWPFDVESQLVFSSLIDFELTNAANTGYKGTGFNAGVSTIQYPQTTVDGGNNPAAAPTHTAIITMYEACWYNSWSASFSRDQAVIMENGSVTITDMHDFASVYGEFLATGLDPTIGQLGSIRYSNQNSASFGVGQAF